MGLLDDGGQNAAPHRFSAGNVHRLARGAVPAVQTRMPDERHRDDAQSRERWGDDDLPADLRVIEQFQGNIHPFGRFLVSILLLKRAFWPNMRKIPIFLKFALSSSVASFQIKDAIQTNYQSGYQLIEPHK